jgi:hypothetical protein
MIFLLLFTVSEIALPIWQGWGSPSAVFWEKLMSSLLCYLFTLCEIALPIWQGWDRFSAVLWDKLMTLLLCYLGSLSLHFLFVRDWDRPDAVLGPESLQVPGVHHEQQQGRTAQGQQGLGGKFIVIPSSNLH